LLITFYREEGKASRGFSPILHRRVFRSLRIVAAAFGMSRAFNLDGREAKRFL